MKKPDAIVKNVVKAMIAARKEQGLSHEKIGQTTGLHRTSIGQIESGKIQPTLLTCLKIAEALNVDLGKLICDAQK